MLFNKSIQVYEAPFFFFLLTTFFCLSEKRNTSKAKSRYTKDIYEISYKITIYTIRY